MAWPGVRLQDGREGDPETPAARRSQTGYVSCLDEERSSGLTWGSSGKLGSKLHACQLQIKHAPSLAEDSFDVREFNNEVLKAGRVPLHLLEKSIEQWIDDVRVGAYISSAETLAGKHCFSTSSLLFVCSVLRVITG